jgi:long-chain fatty acid transport protein
MAIRSPRAAAASMAAALTLALASSEVQAAGFSVFEQGARGMGFAGAYTAQSQDPSAIFHNAAGIAFLKGKRLYFGGTFVKPYTDFTGADPYPGAGRTETGDVGVIPLPALYYSQQFTDRLSFGLGVNTPYGLKTQWAEPDTYSGRYISLMADLKSVSINPVIAYKLEDRLAIGAGVDVRFSKVTLARRVPLVNPFSLKVIDVAQVDLRSDWNAGIGFNLGVLAKPTEKLSVGASYRHKVKVDYTGTATFIPISSGDATLDGLVKQTLPQGSESLKTGIEFPGIATVGAAYALDDWTVEADLVWFQWSTFDSLQLKFPDRPDLDETIPEAYTNVFQYRFGLERRFSDRLAVRGGYFYDNSPSPAASVSPLLPDADRHGFALGASFTRGNLSLDLASWYLRFKERSTEGLSRDHYDGTYQSSAITFCASLGYSF